jgi:hypothetical protein
MPPEFPSSSDSQRNGFGKNKRHRTDKNRSIQAILCPSCTAPISPTALQLAHPVCGHCGVTLSIETLTGQQKTGGAIPSPSNEKLNEWLRLAEECVGHSDFAGASDYLSRYLQVRTDDPAVWYRRAIAFGAQGELGAMYDDFEKTLDLTGPGNRERPKQIASLILKYARQLHGRLPRFQAFQEVKGISPSTFAHNLTVGETWQQRVSGLGSINSALEFAERCDSSNSEVLEFVIQTYGEEIEELDNFISYAPDDAANFGVLPYDFRQQRDTITSRRRAAIARMCSRFPNYSAPDLRPRRKAVSSNTSMQPAGCGSMVLIAFTIFAAAAFAATK